MYSKPPPSVPKGSSNIEPIYSTLASREEISTLLREDLLKTHYIWQVYLRLHLFVKNQSLKGRTRSYLKVSLAHFELKIIMIIIITQLLINSTSTRLKNTPSIPRIISKPYKDLHHLQHWTHNYKQLIQYPVYNQAQHWTNNHLSWPGFSLAGQLSSERSNLGNPNPPWG